MNGIWQDYIGQLIEDKVEKVRRNNLNLRVLWIEVVTDYEVRTLTSEYTIGDYADFLEEFRFTPLEDAQSIRVMMTEGLDCHYGILGFLTDYDDMPDWKEIDTTPPSDEG